MAFTVLKWLRPIPVNDCNSCQTLKWFSCHSARPLCPGFGLLMKQGPISGARINYFGSPGVLGLLDYVSRAHESEIRKSFVVRPSPICVALIFIPNVSFLWYFICCFPGSMYLDLFWFFEKEKKKKKKKQTNKQTGKKLFQISFS